MAGGPGLEPVWRSGPEALLRNIGYLLALIPYIKLSCLGLDREMATKWLHKWYPGPILRAFCPMFRA